MKAYAAVKHKYAPIKCLFRSARSEATTPLVPAPNAPSPANTGSSGDVCLSASNSAARTP